MRKIISVAALLLALTCPAYAGDMQNDKPQANTIQEPTVPTQEPTTEGEIQNDATDSLTQLALDVLAVLPSLF